jgi:3-phenylpropionate/trans-cinnamate dioxygenase ferredoxin subunit
VSDTATFVPVAGTGDIAEGEMLGLTLPNGAPVCLFRSRGEIGAIGNVCTHAQFLMSDGVLHGDGFDCRTGAVRRHPASEPLPVYPVRIDGDRVLVSLTPERAP